MLKYAEILRTISGLITDKKFVRPLGEGPEAEAALDLIMETVSVLDYDCDYFPGAEFEQVVNDSRQVAGNSIFVAISGARLDGKTFVPQALNQGAKVIISEESVESLLLHGTVNLIVKDCYQVYALLSELSYNFPTRQMNGFAITGTNGKTTSAMIIRHLLQQSECSCGMISTVEYDLGKAAVISADRTTPQAGELFSYFQTMRQNELDNFVMEVSSHALAQHRIGTIKFQAAIFSNLTGDHLDYHHTFEEYFRVKKQLFTEHLADNAPAIINSDDPYGAMLSQDPAVKNPVTFGRQSGQWRIKNIAVNASGSSFTLDNGTITQTFRSNLIGLHNVYNLTGAVLALHCSNKVTLADSAAILSASTITVPGRLETFLMPSGAIAAVDYAHTHDALQHVLTTLRQLITKRLICVFGAGGDRDRSKRPLMGQAAALLADVIVLTSDNPRSEDPLAIIEEIRSGIPADYAQLYIEPDRRQAIAMAIKMAAAGDAVLIAGKGHENYQIINHEQLHFDDREAVKALQMEL